MHSIKTVGESYARALEAGLVECGDVIRWVDGVIAASDEPPFALLDASTAGEDRASLIAALHALPGDEDALGALRLLMGHMRRALAANRSSSQAIARCLFEAALRGEASGTPMEGPMFTFDDGLDLARGGIGPSREELERELGAFLAEHGEDLRN